MKKKLKFGILFGVLLVIGFLGYNIAQKISHKNKVSERVKMLPDFTFKTLNGNVFTQDSLLKNKATVFVYFNSECDFCIAEATKIQERLEAFKKCQLVFVSFESSKKIEKFAKGHKLLYEKNVVFLEDRKGGFSQIFDVNSIPYTVLYDAENKLLHKFKGAAKVDLILKYLIF